MTYKEARVYLDKVSEFAELVEEVQKAIVRMETRGFASPTVFEIETAIAFLYFLWRHGTSRMALRYEKSIRQFLWIGCKDKTKKRLLHICSRCFGHREV